MTPTYSNYIIKGIFEGGDAEWTWHLSDKYYVLQIFEGGSHGRLFEAELGSDGKYWGGIIKSW